MLQDRFGVYEDDAGEFWKKYLESHGCGEEGKDDWDDIWNYITTGEDRYELKLIDGETLDERSIVKVWFEEVDLRVDG